MGLDRLCTCKRCEGSDQKGRGQIYSTSLIGVISCLRVGKEERRTRLDWIRHPQCSYERVLEVAVIFSSVVSPTRHIIPFQSQKSN